MCKLRLLIFFLFSVGIITAQTKTVNITTAGTLNTLITATEATTITTLTVSGNIDARDIAYMRDKIILLSVLDLSSTNINAYTGIDGTYSLATIIYPANELPLCAFYNASSLAYKSTLTSIKLPSTLKSIGGSAFYYCYGLTGTFTIPASVTSIGSYALYGCSALTAYVVEIANTRYSSNNGVLFNKKQDSLFICPSAKTGAYTIPSTVVYIGSSAFDYCYGLTGSLIIPSSVKTIDSYAFYYCTGFSGDLTIPASVTSIYDGSFYGCSGLNGAVTIPKSVTYMGAYVFFECNKITSFQVDQLNPKFSSNNDVLYSKNMDTLHICPGGKSGNFSIPISVKAIGSYAFYKCSSLTGSLLIPITVNLIGSYTFYGCNAISAYEVDPLNLKYLSNNGVLFNKNQDTLLVCPAAKTGSYTLPTTVKAIGTYAFYYCTSLTGSINIPASLSSIGDYAFYGCTQLAAFNVDAANQRYSSIDGVLFNYVQDSLLICPLGKTGNYIIPSTVNTVDFYAFDSCVGLTSITIPNSVTNIGTYAFEYCTGLSEITLPKNISNIGIGAFYSCTNLQKVSIAKVVPPAIDSYTFGLVNKSTCQLIVPTGSLIAYQISSNWKDFTLIKENNFDTAVKLNYNNQIKIYRMQQNLVVEGLNPGENVVIYELSGKKISNYISISNSLSIPVSDGFYLVKTKLKTEKVVI